MFIALLRLKGVINIKFFACMVFIPKVYVNSNALRGKKAVVPF